MALVVPNFGFHSAYSATLSDVLLTRRFLLIYMTGKMAVFLEICCLVDSCYDQN